MPGNDVTVAGGGNTNAGDGALLREALAKIQQLEALVAQQGDANTGAKGGKPKQDEDDTIETPNGNKAWKHIA